MIQMVQSEPATGQSAPMWFSDKIRLAETRPTGETVLVVLNDYSILGESFSCLPSYPLDHFSVVNCIGVTDADANLRVHSSQLAGWSQNLLNLGTVARMVIPGLRDLTPSEQDGLREYRKRLFRTV